MSNLLSLHRRIERQHERDATEKELAVLRMQLRQRDVVLFAILKKLGPQRVSPDDMNAVQEGSLLHSRVEDNVLVLECVDPDVHESVNKDNSVNEEVRV